MTPEEIETRFKLANAWQIRGHFERAREGYLAVLKVHKNHVPTIVQMGHLEMRQRREQEAVARYDDALAIDPDAVDLTAYYRYLGFDGQPEKTSTPRSPTAPPDGLDNRVATDARIDLRAQKVFAFHRSGWAYAIQALMPLHNPDGVLFDGFLERHFIWRHHFNGKRPRRVLDKMHADGVFELLASSEEKGTIPYRRPWVGFIHNPQNMPRWFHYESAPQRLLRKKIWQQSLPHCIGLFTLSEYHAQWLRTETGVPVSALVHPTAIPDIQFDTERFLANPRKKIVQIGWWLRKLNAICQLPIAAENPLGYEKIRLVPNFSTRSGEVVEAMSAIEIREEKLHVEPVYNDNTRTISQLDDTEYDNLLAENIAFVDLYDSNANNAIIECIARATPLLINRLPAILEYLGADYPMYFDDYDDAAAKAMDTSRIRDTHMYLADCDTRKKLSGTTFCDSLRNSDVYQTIPASRKSRT